MKFEKSCGAIVFHRFEDGIKFLILYRAPSENFKESYDFSRGNVESEDKTEEQVARREIKEETGITELDFYQFRQEIRLFYRFKGELIKKRIIYLLAETKQEEVKLSFEHNDFRWLGYKDAFKLLTHKNAKDILTRANNFLKEGLKQKTLF